MTSMRRLRRVRSGSCAVCDGPLFYGRLVNDNGDVECPECGAITEADR